MSLELRKNLGTILDRVYPGLLDEDNTTIRAVQLEGSSNALFVQLDNKTLLDSAALQKYSGTEKDFRAKMVSTTGVTVSKFGDLARLSTAHNVVYSTNESALFPNRSSYREGLGVANINQTTALLGMGGNKVDAAKYATIRASVKGGPMWCMEDLGGASSAISRYNYAHVEGTRVDANKVIEAYLAHFKKFVKSLNADACIGYFMCLDKATYGNFVPTDYAQALTHADASYANQSKMCEVPGYQLVWMRIGNMDFDHFGYVNFFTYIPGKADSTIINWDVPVIPKDGGGWTTANFKTVVQNRVSSVSTGASLVSFMKAGVHVSPIDDATPTQLLAACKRDVAGWTTSNATSVMLFGIPDAKFYAQGSVVETEVMDESDERDWRLLLTTFNAKEFAWLIDKSWYRNYMETGYHLFTPRASNIKENVLKEWDALEYDTIIMRKVSAVEEFTFTVETLPEALTYAKARAKACKDNDWLAQPATKDRSLTWAEVSTKEKNARGRLIWGSFGVFEPIVNAVSVVKVSKPVSYSITSGVITRVEGETSQVIDVNNEDDQALLVFDRLYNEGAKITGGTWDDAFPLTESELSFANNSDMTTSNSINFFEKNVIGFGAWIDPTGRADISNLSAEQKYRLHITNSISLDRMLSPLARIFESFGYSSLVKYLR